MCVARGCRQDRVVTSRPQTVGVASTLVISRIDHVISKSASMHTEEGVSGPANMAVSLTACGSIKWEWCVSSLRDVLEKKSVGMHVLLAPSSSCLPANSHRQACQICGGQTQPLPPLRRWITFSRIRTWSNSFPNLPGKSGTLTKMSGAIKDQQSSSQQLRICPLVKVGVERSVSAYRVSG